MASWLGVAPAGPGAPFRYGRSVAWPVGWSTSVSSALACIVDKSCWLGRERERYIYIYIYTYIYI